MPTQYRDTDLLVFLRVFSIEIVGRYAHLSEFLDHIERETQGDSPELLITFSKQIKQMMQDIAQEYRFLFDLPEGFSGVDQLDLFFNYLVEKASDFQSNHKKLRWLPSPWPETELFQFLSQVCEKGDLNERFHRANPTAVFSDEYNFLTADVNRSGKAVAPSSLVVWALPKCEIGNPLLWPVLVHEVAHGIFDDGFIPNVIDNVRERSEHEHADLDLLRAWATELNADLFGFRLLGPAYLFCIIYFSIFFVRTDLRAPVAPSRGRALPQHPPPELRIRLLTKEMSSLNVGASPKLRRVREALQIADRLLGARLQFDFNAARQSRSPDDLEERVSSTLVNELWSQIKAAQEKEFPGLDLPPSSLEQAMALADVLKNSQIASSVINHAGRKKLRAYLEGRFKELNGPASSPSAGNAKAGDTRKISAEQSAIRLGKRKEALAGLDDQPATVTQVLNAGWFERMRSIAIDSPNGGLPEVLDDYEALILEPACQLRRSIQTSLIFSALASHFPTDLEK